MPKRWTERTKPICPMNLKTGDKACLTQCLYCFHEGENQQSEKVFGCLMLDEMELRVKKLKMELAPKKIANPVVTKQGAVDGK